LRILDRYILGDVTRLVLLTTGVLVTVIAFGAAIKPLAHDNLLTAGQTAKYIGLAIVPMLQFALPFAAGFASTMSLHRMANDNEIVAAASSGVSYQRILMPIFALGIVLTVLMALLTQSIVPRFWSLAERAVAMDVTRIFQASIQRGEPFQFGDRQIYADEVLVEMNPADTEVDTRLILLRVVAAQIDGDGRIEREVTANTAVVDVYRHPDVTYVKLSMLDTVAYDPDAGMLAWAERIDSRTIVIQSTRHRDCRHLSGLELMRTHADPDLYDSVQSRRRALGEALRDGRLWSQIHGRLREEGRIELASGASDGPKFIVAADRLVDGVFTRDDGAAVEITQRIGDRSVRRLRSSSPRLDRHVGRPDDPVTFDLVLGASDVTDFGPPESTNRRREITLENLVISPLVADDLTALSSPELLALAHAGGADVTRSAKNRAARLETKIKTMRWEIKGRLLKRFAVSLTALLLVLLGATLAMWLRESLPLTIYLWAFLPSILDLVFISGGEQMMREGNLAVGAVVMWSGNAALIVILFSVFRRLVRS